MGGKASKKYQLWSSARYSGWMFVCVIVVYDDETRPYNITISK